MIKMKVKIITYNEFVDTIVELLTTAMVILLVFPFHCHPSLHNILIWHEVSELVCPHPEIKDITFLKWKLGRKY
jgi:hypothetical protein